MSEKDEQREIARITGIKSTDIKGTGEQTVSSPTVSSVAKTNTTPQLASKAFISLLPVAFVFMIFFLLQAFQTTDGAENVWLILLVPDALGLASVFLAGISFAYLPWALQRTSKARLVGFFWFATVFILFYVIAASYFSSPSSIGDRRSYLPELQIGFFVTFFWLIMRTSFVFSANNARLNQG